MLDGGGGGGTSRGGSTGRGDLERGVEALRNFQKRVNALLTELEGGEAGKAKVAAQTVSRASLSGSNTCFGEADGLYTQYNRVHQALVSLSRTLGDQIECLKIGVHAAEVGFDNVEEDVRRRFAQIQARIDQEHAAQREREKSAKPEPQNTNDTNSESGW